MSEVNRKTEAVSEITLNFFKQLKNSKATSEGFVSLSKVAWNFTG